MLVLRRFLRMVFLADVIGVNRGEVSRLWIFLACFWAIPAAYYRRRLESSMAFTLVLVTTLLQNALVRRWGVCVGHDANRESRSTVVALCWLWVDIWPGSGGCAPDSVCGLGRLPI